jgi:hypothetical protein
VCVWRFQTVYYGPEAEKWCIVIVFQLCFRVRH